jgi:hypothetical protein
MTNQGPDTTDKASLVRWTNSLILYAEGVLAYAMAIHRDLKTAEDKFGARAGYVETIARAYALAWNAANICTGLYGNVRTANYRDFMRLEAPRQGSIVKEKAADNTTATRDHDNW